jgi:hypothetical protein
MNSKSIPLRKNNPDINQMNGGDWLFGDPENSLEKKISNSFLSLAKSGDFYCAANLLRDNVIEDLCVTDENDNNVLHYVAFYCDNELNQECVDFLNQLKGKPKVAELTNKKNKEGNTALHVAALSGNDDLVNYLLKLGADPNIKNAQGKSLKVDDRSNNMQHLTPRVDDLRKIFLPRGNYGSLESPVDEGVIKKIRIKFREKEPLHSDKMSELPDEKFEEMSIRVPDSEDSYEFARNPKWNEKSNASCPEVSLDEKGISRSINVSKSKESKSEQKNENIDDDDTEKFLDQMKAVFYSPKVSKSQSGGYYGNSKMKKIEGSRHAHYDLDSAMESESYLERERSYDDKAQALHTEAYVKITKLGYPEEEAKIYKAAVWKRAKKEAEKLKEKGERVDNLRKSQIMLDMISEKVLKDIMNSGEYKQTKEAIREVEKKKSERAQSSSESASEPKSEEPEKKKKGRKKKTDS